MKINMPVTNTEVLLTETSSIVSKTDLKGRITYVNRELIEISGFLESELIGKSHNIVRHPDMPPEAFDDLWTTVKAGRPWNGIVKNRCKNGDYYWVEANVAPIREAGKVVGYMSVRSKPSTKQVDDAEALYKRMRDGKSVKQNPAEALLNRISSLPLAFRMGVAVTAPVIAVLISLVLNNFQTSAFLTSAIVGTIASITAIVFLNKFIVNALTKASDAIKATTEGDFKFAINCAANDEIGKLMQLIKIMQIRVGFDVNDMQKAKEEASKLQAAIDNSTTAFSFSDNHNRISYMNNAAKDIWKQMSSNIKTQHPDFEQEAMLGLPFSQFFENDALKQQFSVPFKTSDNIDLAMYGADLNLTIVPVHTNSGAYIGYMTQWRDVTAELLAEKEVIRLVDEAVEGNLSERVDTSILPEGFIKKIGVGINQVLNAVIEPLNVAASYVDKISNGEIPPKITDEYKGDFNSIKNNLNQCIEAVNLLISDTSKLSSAAVHGQLSTRAEAKNHRGDFRKIVEGVNSTLDSVIGPLNMAAQYIDSISKGNIPDKITEEYRGDFNTIKLNLNTCVNAVNILVEDANMLADSAQNGYISKRVDANRHQGDYRQIVEGMNKTLDLIVSPITTVKEAVETITTAANEISTGNSDLSSRTEQQASSLEETAASMEELASTVKLNSSSAQNASELVRAASEIADKGGKVVGEVVTTMNDISKSAQKIEEIISVINSIAFQTNILALNAAVEAARAGEQGKGFAVVASEVGNLAQHSSKAAKEIESLITESVTKTADGTKLVESAGKTMEEIVNSVKQVTKTISEISTSSNEQAAGINQVNEAVTSMDEATQQNSALVEQAAAASESLKDQAIELSDVVSMFKLSGEPQKANQPATRKTKQHDALNKDDSALKAASV